MSNIPRDRQLNAFARIYDKRIPFEPTPNILEKEKPYLSYPDKLRFILYDTYWDIKLLVPEDLISLEDNKYIIDNWV